MSRADIKRGAFGTLSNDESLLHGTVGNVGLDTFEYQIAWTAITHEFRFDEWTFTPFPPDAPKTPETTVAETPATIRVGVDLLAEYLAAHDREVAERAWDEGARALAALQKAGPGYEVGNPYRVDGQEAGR